ncbi:hypothetical protein [Aureimonas sp. AU12]|uniref:hypothetical protein n=1 Tax=Aureimonas sp. AU12 TaxID=1638161 RepID=UPI00078177D8|nr:hypothetical protein [Aureimonas sp. AU12]
MKDAAPRIFRSLERQAGQQEFDTVVAAAVAAYSSLRHPSTSQAEELSRLVLPLWSRVNADTQRNLAAALSHTQRMPRPLVDLLLAAPIEVGAPFLVSSPALTGADIARLAASGDERVVRLVKNRVGRADAPAACPLPEPEAAPSAPAEAQEAASEIPAPSLAADFLSVTPMMPDVAGEPPLRTAASVRETLRRLALAGRKAPPPVAAQPAPAPEPPTFAALMMAAMRRDEPRFYRTLSDIFGLTDTTLATIRDDEGGERLAVALKALKANAADAMSILMLVKPSIGLDVAAFDEMARFYKALRSEDCRAAIGASRLPRPAEHQPLTAPERYDTAPMPRRDFGRRAARPDERKAKG